MHLYDESYLGSQTTITTGEWSCLISFARVSPSCKEWALNTTNQQSRWPSGLGVRLDSQRSLVRLPAGTYIFILSFSSPFSSLQLGEALANEIKHDHSLVVIVVFRQQIQLTGADPGIFVRGRGGGSNLPKKKNKKQKIQKREIFGLTGVKSCHFRQNKQSLSWNPGIVCMTIWKKGLGTWKWLEFLKHLLYV